jgi:2-methylaconitate cis-trans-isomerase PrpF
MGGGISSLSKVCVVGPSTRADADIDYTFAQVAVKEARVDYSGNCGNMSSAIRPYGADEDIVKAHGPDALVRVHNIVHAVTRPSSDPDAAIRIAMPSGVLTVAATVRQEQGVWLAEQGAFYRTQRRLFDGYVYVRASRLASAHTQEQAVAA